MTDFEFEGNPVNVASMEAYMKNKFSFKGVKAPERKQQAKEFIKQSKNLSRSKRIDLIHQLYAKKEREYQYLAIDICEANAKKMIFEELVTYTSLIEEKSWWDTVDAWRKIYGIHIKAYPENKERVFLLFYQHPNFWMRRVSIILQLSEKENTDTLLLEKSIKYDLQTDEFFIQKAIGWSLRQYSKSNPEWVSDFVNQTKLSPLAKREALKQISMKKRLT